MSANCAGEGERGFGSGGIGNTRRATRATLPGTSLRPLNPVKLGHRATGADWPYSMFRRWVAVGACPADWAGDFDEE